MRNTGIDLALGTLILLPGEIQIGAHWGKRPRPPVWTRVRTVRAVTDVLEKNRDARLLNVVGLGS